MNLKHVFACIAVSAVCHTLPVQAQTNVLVYGRLVVGVVNYSAYSDGRGSVTKESSFSSRLGFKGSEALGDDLNALFVLEGGFNPDTGSGGVISREASIGLGSPYGKIRFGFMLTPLDDLHGIVGPGYLSNVSNDNLNGFWANGYNNSFTGASADGSSPCIQTSATQGNANTFAFDNRYGNSARYDSPNMHGFSFATHLALGEPAQNLNCHSTAWSSKLQFNSGQLVAALAYNLHHNVRGINLDDSIVLFALGFNLTSQINLSTYLQHIKYDNIGSHPLQQNGIGVRGRFFQHSHTFELAWYRGGEGKGDQTPVFSGIFTGAGTQADLMIVGYRYDLSKRSQLWSQYAILRNGSHAGYELGGAAAVSASARLGQHPQAIAFGIKHDF